jgi:hypothetical protein
MLIPRLLVGTNKCPVDSSHQAPVLFKANTYIRIGSGLALVQFPKKSFLTYDSACFAHRMPEVGGTLLNVQISENDSFLV